MYFFEYIKFFLNKVFIYPGNNIIMLFVNSLERIPEEKSFSKKELIFYIVAYYPGLNCSQITKLLRKKFSISVSNQGVYKLLSKLADSEAIEKNDLKYFVNHDWISITEKNLEIIKKREKEIEQKEILFV
jgi:hypothetical protein